MKDTRNIKILIIYANKQNDVAEEEGRRKPYFFYRNIYDNT